MFPYSMSPALQMSQPMERDYSGSSDQSSFSFSDAFPSSYEVDIPRTQPSSLDPFSYFPPSSPYTLPDFSPPSPYTLSEFSPPSSAPVPFAVPSSYSSFCEPLLPYTPNCDDVWMPQQFPPMPTDLPAPEPEQEQSKQLVKPFACDECGRGFTRSADLRRHQTSVHYPVFKDCPVPDCSRKNGNGFPRQDHLNEHLRSFHHVHVPKRRRMTKPA